MQQTLRYLGLAFFLALTALPLLAGLIYALLFSLGIVGIIHDGFTLGYWREAIEDGEVWMSLGYSLYIATVSSLLSIAIALGLVIKGRAQFQKGLLSYAIYFPLAIPGMVAAFFVFQLMGKSGLLSRLTFGLGMTSSIETFPDLVHDAWGIGMITAHVMLAVPFLLILFLNLARNERLEELSQLASTLGAVPKDISRKVWLPILLKKSFPTLILYFIFVLGAYEIPLLLGRESPQMVSVLIIRKLQRYNLLDKPEAYIIALIYSVLVLSLLWLALRNRQSSSAT